MAPLARDRASAADFVAEREHGRDGGGGRGHRARAEHPEAARLPARAAPDDGAPRVAVGPDDARCSSDLGAVAPDVNRLVRQLGPFSRGGRPGAPAARRRDRRRPPGARQGAADRAGPRPVRERRAAAVGEPAVADDVAARHRRHRAGDGLSSSTRSPRSTASTPSATTCAPALLVNACSHVHDQLVAGLHARTSRTRARTRAPTRRRASAAAARRRARQGYADTRRSPDLRRLDAYLHGLDPDKAVPRDDRDGAAAAPAPRARPRQHATPAAATRSPRRRPGRHRRPAAPRLPDGRLMRRGSASIAANPVLIGAATTLVVARRGLPRLQRELRPAVRAQLRAEGRGARRREPRRRQRRADRRHAGRDGRRDHAGRRRKRPVLARLDAEARDDGSSRCRSTRP